MKKNFKFDFQDIVDIWSKQQITDLKRKGHITFKKSKKFATKWFNSNLKEEYTNLETFKNTRFALNKGLSHKLSLENLELIGELIRLDCPEIEHILKSNVIKHKDTFYKIDDPQDQQHITKALKSTLNKLQKNAA